MDEITSYLVTAGLGIAAGAVLYRLQQTLDPTARLYWAETHGFAFSAGAVAVTTRTILIENGGRAPAKDVEITHVGKPQHFQLYPPRPHTDSMLADGHHVISIGTLAPKEAVAVELLAVAQGQGAMLAHTLQVRGNGIAALKVPAAPQRVWPRWMKKVAALSIWSGWAAWVVVLVWFGHRIGATMGFW